MKVVFATGIFPPDIGGPANSVSTLAEAWSARGNAVAVVTYSDVGDDGVRPAYEVHRVPRAMPVWKRYWIFLRTLWRASDAPGPIFAQDGVASGIPALVVAALRRRRLVVRVAGDFAWEHAQVQAGYRGSLEEFQDDGSVPPGMKLLRFLQRFVYRRADRVIVPSRYLAGVARAWGVPESRIRVIYNGVDLPKAEGAAPKSPRRIFAAGRLVPWKNFDVLIKAMSKVIGRHPDAVLEIAGEGPEMTRLRALAGAPMLAGKVAFLGRLSRGEVCRRIAESGVFVLPSSYEGFSHQLVEAFACGAAVVASRAGGNPELVVHGRNGLLVDPGDAGALAAAIASFLDDPVLASECAAEAGKGLERFSIEEQVRRTTEEVLGAGELRVLLVSRDPSTADPSAPAADRMRAYAERVDALEVVAVGRHGARPRLDCRGYSARVVDGRRGPLSLLALARETFRAAQDAGATLIVAQDPFEAGFAARYAAFRLRVPYVVEDHGAFFAGEAWVSESAMNRLRAAVGRRVVRAAQGVRAVGERAAEAYRAMRLNAPIEVVPVAMRLAAKRLEPKASGPFTLLYAGRFSPEKNLPLLVQALAKLRRHVPDAVLLLCGSGPEETRVKGEAALQGVSDAVRFLPWTEDMASVYATADAAVLASSREGYGRFAAEAMSYGLPVVMTDVGLAREVIRNGVEGIVVPVGDADAFAAAFLKLAQEPHARMMMRAAALRRAESLPTPEQAADRVAAFWKRVAGV